MEIWNPIPNYEEHYLASNFGNIKRIKPSTGAVCGRILKPYFNKKVGYQYITLTKNCVQNDFRLHKLIIASFKGLSDLQVNHIDGNKLNNNLDNLEYVTASQNLYHATRVLNKRSKENHWNSRLTKSDVETIRTLYKTGITQQKIADQFKINRSYVSEIVNYKAWIY